MVTRCRLSRLGCGFLSPVKTRLAGRFQHIQAGLALALDLQCAAGVRKADIMADVVVLAIQAMDASACCICCRGHGMTCTWHVLCDCACMLDECEYLF
jgi:hypothetical protein